MQELQLQSLGPEDPLEKEMAIHSSVLAWEIPLTEETSGLQSMGSQRVRHDWETSHSYNNKWASLVAQRLILTANAEDVGLIPELRRSSGEANGNPLQTPAFLPGKSH